MIQLQCLRIDQECVTNYIWLLEINLNNWGIRSKLFPQIPELEELTKNDYERFTNFMNWTLYLFGHPIWSSGLGDLQDGHYIAITLAAAGTWCICTWRRAAILTGWSHQSSASCFPFTLSSSFSCTNTTRWGRILLVTIQLYVLQFINS